ncbi:MAG: rRNA adenine N-6-methyltransferase family protein [Minisyncoccales bacterium]
MEIKKNPDKGQHFLVDKKILNKEIKISEVSDKDRIIEIGAGDGKLTKEIVKNAYKVRGFELDERYKNKLKELEKEHKNLEIIYSDATKYSWKGFDKIVSNIPYYLGEKVIQKAVIDDVSFLTLIIGENFKEILEKQKSKSGIIANLFYDIEYIKKIEKEAFLPPPRVNSWLVRLVIKEKDKQLRIIKYLLGRRGKIKNAIIYGFVNEGYTKNQAREFLRKTEFQKKILETPTSKITGKRILVLYKQLREFFGEKNCE